MNFTEFKNISKPILTLLLIIVIIYFAFASISYMSYSIIKAVEKDGDVFIPKGCTISEQAKLLSEEGYIRDTTEYLVFAKKMKLNKVYPGKYKLTRDMSYKQLLRLLGTGIQSPIDIIFNNIDDLEGLAGRISKRIEMDSAQLISELQCDTILSKFNLTKENVLFIFIPNTYEAYWTISTEELLKLMQDEYNKFWENKSRIEALKKLKMSREDVINLASIVQKECYYDTEMPMVAGVYINRLKRKMRLQADPTVKFAMGDRGLRRILHKHLKIESPYNTYLNLGLPPTPISLPSITAIDAVLNYKENNYIYFCASEAMDNTHRFAKTLVQHNMNAKMYSNALNKAKIYK